MKINHYWNLLTKKIQVIKPASFLSWKNIKAVFQASLRSMDGLDLEQHVYEQIVWRRTQVMSKSPECWKQGYCKVCGCEILGKTMEDRACGISEVPEMIYEGIEPCFPAMMDQATWEKYKKKNLIKLFE